MTTYPLTDLATAAGITIGRVGGQTSDGNPDGVAELADRIGVSPSTIKRRRLSGLDWDEADTWAGRLGFLPHEVWGDRWWADQPDRWLVGAAAVNAAKETCPQGHPYDATNARGERCCRACWAEASRRCRAKKTRESSFPQVDATMTAHQPTLFEVAAA